MVGTDKETIVKININKQCIWHVPRGTSINLARVLTSSVLPLPVGPRIIMLLLSRSQSLMDRPAEASDVSVSGAAMDLTSSKGLGSPLLDKLARPNCSRFSSDSGLVGSTPPMPPPKSPMGWELVPSPSMTERTRSSAALWASTTLMRL